MGEENHFVAEFYHRLWPWIDHGPSLSFCLDDGGTGKSSTPDVCFRFAGQAKTTRIECKILYLKKGNNKKKNHIRVYPKQLLSWASADCEVTPHLWVAKGEGAEKYFVWSHDNQVFLENLETAAEGVEHGDKRGELVKVPDEITGGPLTFAGMFFRVWQIAIEKHLLAMEMR